MYLSVCFDMCLNVCILYDILLMNRNYFNEGGVNCKDGINDIKIKQVNLLAKCIRIHRRVKKKEIDIRIDIDRQENILACEMFP